MPFNEYRHPDFYGLQLDADIVTPGARVAENVEFRKAIEMSKRPGFRRMNHHHYDGPIVCLPDVQRVCDYGKFLVVSHDVYEHDDGYPGSTPPGGTDPLFSPNPPAPPAIPPVLLAFRGTDGVWTEDDGTNWTACTGLPASGIIWAEVIGEHVVVAASAAVPPSVLFYRSTDRGKTFTLAGQLLGNTTLRPKMCVSTAGRLFAFVYGVGLRYSDDEGVSWTNATWGGTVTNTLWMQTEGASTVYIAEYISAYPNSSVKIWKSINGGVTWNVVYTFADPPGGDYITSVLHLMALGNNCLVVSITEFLVGPGDQYSLWFRSTDGGASWAQFHPAFEEDPRNTYASFRQNGADSIFIRQTANPDSLYYSTDRGATWTLATAIGSNSTSRQLTTFDSDGWYASSGVQLWKSTAVIGAYARVSDTPWAPDIILGVG